MYDDTTFPGPAPPYREAFDHGVEGLDVPISALEHYSYCPRQCALIHVEQVWEENIYTVRGRLAHERVEAAGPEAARGVRVLRSVPLWSERLGLRGKADVVEMRAEGPYPVEYKVGRPHRAAAHPEVSKGERYSHAGIQLCAQALCLEEMLGRPVTRGAIFYHAVRRRHEVVFSEDLRERTEEAVAAIRDILRTQRLPPAPNDARCPNCSLINACLPSVVAESARLRGLQGALFRPIDAPGLSDVADGFSLPGVREAPEDEA
jgi:CRISPR-associated exonuclease Cas4